jgi:hypothetical protein
MKKLKIRNWAGMAFVLIFMLALALGPGEQTHAADHANAIAAARYHMVADADDPPPGH